MKKNKYSISEMSFEEMKEKGLCELSKDDLTTTLAKSLVKNNQVKAYKKLIVKNYNNTGDLKTFLAQLKTLARAEGITQLSKKTKMKRPNIYRFLSEDNRPYFDNLTEIAHNLGIDIKLSLVA
jgi:probable addiction module antidote protein